MEKRVPKLRFPEFEGSWEKKNIGSLGSFFSGGTPTSTNKTYYEGHIPFIGSGKINDSTVDQFITDEALSNSSAKLVEKGDLLYALYGATSGEVAISKINGAINQAVLCIRTDENKIFLKSWFEKNKENILSTYLQGGQGNLSAQIVKSLIINLPLIKEQTKIASFLTAVDDKLQALKQKKTLLEQYKKGVMQKIFSQELRFKDDNGNEYPDWEEKKLGEVANKKSSNISANKIEDNFGDYIIYGASGILKKIDFYKEEDDYISIVKDGAGVGRLLYCKGQSSVLGTMEIIRPNEGIDTYYLFCLLSNIDFVKYVTGSTIPHIYFKDYSSEICGLPCIEEQTKIANFLSAIVDKINHCQSQIEKIEVWKKGLLQQMFV